MNKKKFKEIACVWFEYNSWNSYNIGKWMKKHYQLNPHDYLIIICKKFYKVYILNKLNLIMTKKPFYIKQIPYKINLFIY